MISQAEIIYGELNEIVEDPEAFMKKDFTDRMYELLKLIDKEPEQIDDIITNIELERRNGGFCPECGSPLAIKDSFEYRGECRGLDCKEPIHTQYCQSCSWTEDNDH